MKLIQNFSRFTVSMIFLLVLLIINLGLAFLPLTNSLGYEFSAVNSILLFLLGGFYFLFLLSRGNSSSKNFIETIFVQKKIILAFVLIPLLTGSLSTILLSGCPLTDGLLFYVVVTTPAFFAGLVFAYLSFFISRKFSMLIFLFSFLMIVFASILEIYRYPEVAFYNLLIGYFPGVIYDEDLRVDNLLIAYRLFNIAFFILMIFVIEESQKRNGRRKYVFVSFILLIALGFYLVKPTIHLATNTNRLNESLKNKIVTKNFNIHFPDSIFSNEEAKFAALIHEYYLEQDETFLSLRYKHKIDSYIFRDREQKRTLIGAGNANLAKPWMNQIYLNKSSYVVTVKHELAHLLASEYGVTPFKIAYGFNSAMLEGFAMAVENNYDGYPVHYLAKLARSAGYKVEISKLFSGMNFFFQASSISYVYAGSFIKYLSDLYGIEKVKKLYSDLDFKQHLGKDIEELSKEYENFLSNYKINFNRNKAQLYFAGQTIFKKYCPRIAASSTKKADRLFRESRINEALELYKSVYSYSNLFNALDGIIECYSKQKKYSEAEKYLTREIAKFNKSQYFFYLELMEGDLKIENNKPGEAKALYDSLLVQNPHIDYYNGALLRKAFLSQGADTLRKFLTSSKNEKRVMILKLNKAGVKYFTVPFLIRFEQKNDRMLADYFLSEKDKATANDFLSSYSLMEISKYFLLKGDYDNAQFFAVKAMKGNSNEAEKHCFTENLRMVNWFKNFASETVGSFQYEK